MGTEQFSLCWDNFHSNMSSGLNALLKSEDLVDVTLAAEGRYIKAHKMVLSVCSPYFRELFSVNPCKHPIVFLKDVSYVALNSLLEFMYQGEVKVSQDDLGMFIKTAEALKIKGLTGDGSNSTDLDDQPKIVQPSTPVVETPPVKRPVPSVEKPQQLVRKKMLGPASKRFKSSEPPVKEPQFRPDEADLQPSPLEPNIQFKLEPEETILDQPDVAFDSAQADDDSMDNSLMYKMESSKLDQKAGTSSTSELNDVIAENQAMSRHLRRTAQDRLLSIQNHSVTREAFYQRMDILRNLKKDESYLYYSRDKYMSTLNEIKNSNAWAYRLNKRSRKFDIALFQGVERLVLADEKSDPDVKAIIMYEELYDVIMDAHVRTLHGGRLRMVKELKSRYRNVTYKAVMTYIRLCEYCRRKPKAAKRHPAAYRKSVYSSAGN